MKYKCIRSYRSGDEWLTKDKIYECVDGNFTYDDGYTSRTFSMNKKLKGTKMNYYLEEIKEDNNMKREFKVGDKVRIVGNSNQHGYKIGEIVELNGNRSESVRDKGKFYFSTSKLDGFNISLNNVREDDMELVTSKTLTITTSDTSTTLTDGTHTTTINRYHTDKHDEQIAVNSVIDKYYDELKQIEIEKNKPKVGDTVRVVGRGCLYSTNYAWLELESNNVPLKTAIKWKYGNGKIEDKEYKIVCIHKHNSTKDMLALIEDEFDAFIIGVEGLEVVR